MFVLIDFFFYFYEKENIFLESETGIFLLEVASSVTSKVNIIFCAPNDLPSILIPVVPIRTYIVCR